MTNDSTTAGDVIVPAVADGTVLDPSGALVPAAGKTAVARRNQRGMVSAEWAVGIIAAIAIAGVLLGIVTSGQVHEALLAFILHVISLFATGLGSK